MARLDKSSENTNPLQPEIFEEFTKEELVEILEELTVPEHKRKKDR